MVASILLTPLLTRVMICTGITVPATVVMAVLRFGDRLPLPMSLAGEMVITPMVISRRKRKQKAVDLMVLVM